MGEESFRTPPESLVTGCVLTGNPPKGFYNWNDYFVYCFVNNILFDLKIEAVNPNVSEDE